MDPDRDDGFLLLLLSDANLPTGSFVASSGFESHVTHAFPSDVLPFLRDSVSTYARAALPFARDAHRVLAAFLAASLSEQAALDALETLDALYDASTLNHVARRASRAQGVALLTLYSRGFTRPPALPAPSDSDSERRTQSALVALVDRLKLRVRRENSPGHLPVCWGVLAGALGLAAERSAHLHLFLHARGLLSAAIRMNALGPYAAQQLLLHAVQPLVNAELARTAHLSTGVLDAQAMRDGHSEREDVFAVNERMPATTYPLGEILSARHDMLHSRIFNS
ncbi:urease accessory protein UreF [Vararia minispora EC-137]|uniref:Urease accessory protein UreF n=1 Tax=Vararia minispora EC-137 TaxID=1314806 RepID=A0ACB8Q7B2_9AGAM|nr:urease accessory protein UreF [Vararia minispora EC-137]